MLILVGLIILFAFFVSLPLGFAITVFFVILFMLGEWFRLRFLSGSALHFYVDSYIVKGASSPVRLELNQTMRFAGGEYTLKIICENITTGVKETFTVRDHIGTGSRDYYFRSNTDLPGLEVWTAEPVNTRSLAALPGLWRPRSVKPAVAERLILPELVNMPIPAAPVYIGESLARQRVLKQGNDPSELYGIRDWVQGDSVKQIHQKLTAKYDRLMIGEWAEAELQRFDIGIDPGGYAAAAPERRASLLSVAMSQVQSLADFGYQVYLHLPEYGIWMQVGYSRHDDSAALWHKLAGVYNSSRIPPRPSESDILWFDFADLAKGELRA